MSYTVICPHSTIMEAYGGVTVAESTTPNHLSAVPYRKFNCLSTRCEHINRLQPEKKKRALKHLCILCEILGNEKSTEGGNNKEWCVSLQETRSI